MTLEQTLVSWSSVTRTPVSHDQLAHVVPGALAAYDLPDLAALIAPRPLSILSAVNPALQPLDRETVEDAWQAAARIYAQRKARAALVIKGQ